MNRKELRELIHLHYQTPKFAVNILDNKGVYKLVLLRDVLNSNVLDKVSHELNYHNSYARCADTIYKGMSDIEMAPSIKVVAGIIYYCRDREERSDFYIKEFYR